MKPNLLEASLLVAIIALVFVISFTNPVQEAIDKEQSIFDKALSNEKIVFVSVIDGNSEIYSINND